MVLKICRGRLITPFAYRAVTFSGGAFQLASTREVCSLPTLLGSASNYLATSHKHMVLEPSAPYCYGTQFMGFGLIPFRSPLLGESKQILHRYNTNSHKYHKLNLCICIISVVINVKSVFCFFFFLRLLRCFNSPGTPLIILCVQITDVPSSTGQVTPFGNPRVKGCLPPNRGLSQAATSFIVFLCRGIHHIPFNNFPTFLILTLARNLQSKYSERLKIKMLLYNLYANI